jgi:membrane-bound lytic murein transglycosylase D
MRVDALVDERLDPYKASNAALDMLQDNYEALGSWPLALTAYNHGANGMARAVRDTGSRDIGRIISEYTGPRFGFASRNFYPEFLAALEVERDAERYFGSFSKDAAPDFAQYELTAFVDANVIAHNLGVGLEDLRKDNPALQAAIWSGNKRVPKGYILKINKNLLKRDIVTGFNAIAASEFYAAQVPDVSYQVRSGDSLSGIASQYNTTVAELVAINQLRDRNAIRVGQKIILPQRNGVVPTLVVNNATEIPQDGEYQVRRGDTISTIAAKFKLTTTTLLALNNMRTGNLIHPGQMLRLNPESTTVQSPVEVVPPAIATLAPTAPASVPVERLAANIPTTENSQNGSLPSAQLTQLYEVATNNTIEILADETLGHYANWLGQDAGVLRRLNNMRANASVQLGKRIKLDFSKVDKTDFEKKRAAHHQNLHASFFDTWRVSDTQNYSIKKSDLVLNLARERAIPMWLFKQYNPEVDSSDVKVGQVVVFPVVEKIVN